VFLPQAASGFAQVFSTHFPQSVLANDGAGGGAAAVASAVAVGALGVSAGAADADAAALSEPAGASELAAEAELSSAGLSGGLVSPPPHASQASGTVTMRTREMRGRVGARLMVVLDCVARRRIES
jgi:hypothetical protein